MNQDFSPQMLIFSLSQRCISNPETKHPSSFRAIQYIIDLQSRFACNSFILLLSCCYFYQLLHKFWIVLTCDSLGIELSHWELSTKKDTWFALYNFHLILFLCILQNKTMEMMIYLSNNTKLFKIRYTTDVDTPRFAGYVCLYLNSAVNPIVYSLCNRKYRQAFRETFLPQSLLSKCLDKQTDRSA